MAAVLGPHPLLAPVGAAVLGGMPFLWLIHRKNKRMKKFLDAMPEAVELIGRALRAGHGLASGLRLVAEEMKGPIADEFGRVFEEQNLGIPIEMSLRGMADRIPAMDVRFFVIAVIIQRSTGGDLAEVLDKIGKLIRQRFELFGHVKALTAEGRLSGVVLLALPPGLLGFLSISNYNYVAPLFTTPLGNKMLIITAALPARRRLDDPEDRADQGMIDDDDAGHAGPARRLPGDDAGGLGGDVDRRRPPGQRRGAAQAGARTRPPGGPTPRRSPASRTGSRPRWPRRRPSSGGR